MRRAGVSDLVVEDDWDRELGGEVGERKKVVMR